MKGWTKEAIEAHQRHHGFLKDFVARGQAAQKAVDKIVAKQQRMNQTEFYYSLVLKDQKAKGEIVDFQFEGMRLAWGVDPKTGKPMWYKPDFVVTMPLGSGSVFPIKIIEVKGQQIWDRDIVRFKGARAWWPQFDFEMWQRQKDGRWVHLLSH